MEEFTSRFHKLIVINSRTGYFIDKRILMNFFLIVIVLLLCQDGSSPERLSAARRRTFTALLCSRTCLLVRYVELLFLIIVFLFTWTDPEELREADEEFKRKLYRACGLSLRTDRQGVGEQAVDTSTEEPPD